MKKQFLLILCALTIATVSAQNIMVVEQNDNTTTEFKVDDIKRVYFKNNGGVNPSNSVLSSRLKDKDGNPVFLTFVGSQYDENDGYGTHFIYNNNGDLTSFGMLPERNRGKDAFFVDGLAYHSYSTLPEFTPSEGSTDLVDVNMTLNADGFVSSLSYVFREMKLPNGYIDDLFKGDYTMTYNSHKQLVKIEGYVHYENNEEENEGGDETISLTWENGNLKKVERTYTEIEDVGGEGLSYPFSINIEYGNEKNICRQYTKGLSSIRFFWGEWGIEELFLIGLFGESPAYLPKEITIIKGDKRPSTTKHTYSINENGTIATEQEGNQEAIVYKYK